MLLSVLPVELWDQVALHFDRPEFASLVLLNKNNNEYWTPYLYHTLSITNENQDKTLATDNGQAMLRRNVQHIKTANIRSHKALALDALGALGTELDLTTLFVRWQPYKDMKIALDPLIRLLECSSNLCHLTISNIGPEPVGSVLITIARCLPRLQSLSLFKDNEPIVRPIIVREFLETCSSELETLTLGVNCSSDSITIKEDLAVMSLAGPEKGSRTHPKLKCFHFAEDDWMDTTNSILPAILTTFLEGCPNLEIVDNWKIWQSNRTPWMFKHEAIIDIVRKTLGVRLLPRFFTSHETNMGYHDHALAKAISDLGIQDKTGMQEIWLSIDLELCPGDFGSDMSETSQAIAQAARKRGLQKIHVGFAQTMPTQDVEAILHHGRDLRIFRSYYFPILTVTDPLLLLPWNCHWLRCLHIQIEGIPRPDITIDYQGQPIPAGTPLHSGTMEESRSVQRKVYSLLAGLRCLETLRLGQDSRPYHLEQGQLSSGKQVYYDDGWQSTCLEMTLESGMGVLSQLKRMQHLQVQNMEHRIGVRELWWMERNWPNLRSVQYLG
ncbi:hypothetical protein BGZ97_007280 [Linnemannia gamsii]|jgi:hypothetical protein|uniref:Uncharacterized protein n=1 Tax=Linnemannia gamsii TaxID=64522 RepID=A0A9P6URK0_9FUNG|nr:hypothetical protein BGZ97_007280 [Linnemannia gamsii]